MPMLFQRIEAVGLSHYSYFLGDGGEAIVIDPRRDVDAYVELAMTHGYRIAHVLETHRHEDFILGSTELAERTGAEVWHADDQEAYRYGRGVRNGQRWRLGERTLTAMDTPGHTRGHVVYALSENDGTPSMVFSGDALMAGEVGRVDLGGEEHAEEAAERLYQSLHDVILPLGDGVVVCPAHGGGSACGAAIADRPWTTIGLERRVNGKLSLGREDFVRTHAEESRGLPVPPYFSHMRQANLDPPRLGRLPEPEPLDPGHFSERAADGATVVDTRQFASYASGHIPGSISIQLDELGKWAGWFLKPGEPLLLVTEWADSTETVRQLARIGFDAIEGSLDAGGVLKWLTAGLPGSSIGLPDARRLHRQLFSATDDQRRKMAEANAYASGFEMAPTGDARPFVLDVRTATELEAVPPIEGAYHIPLDSLPDRIDEVPSDRPLTVVCGSGVRSMMAASILARRGERYLDVLYGGMTAWSQLPDRHEMHEQREHLEARRR